MRVETERKVGYHAGFGGELRVHRHVGLYGDYRYTFIRFGGEDSDPLINLPLVNRDLYSLLSATGGVTSNENSNSLGGPEQLTTINGSQRAQIGSVNFQLDGGNNTAGLRGTGNPAPNPEAVQEFRVVGVLQKRDQFLFSGGSDDQNNVIYMPYNVARKLNVDPELELRRDLALGLQLKPVLERIEGLLSARVKSDELAVEDHVHALSANRGGHARESGGQLEPARQFAMSGHHDGIYTLTFSPDGKRMAFANEQLYNQIEIADVADVRSRQRRAGLTAGCSSFGAQADASFVCSEAGKPARDGSGIGPPLFAEQAAQARFFVKDHAQMEGNRQQDSVTAQHG